MAISLEEVYSLIRRLETGNAELACYTQGREIKVKP